MPVDPKLVHCDLCILAYQNYHQSVIWPLDPWYEVLARVGTDRRTLFMQGVRTLASPAGLTNAAAIYAGPLGTRAGFGVTNDTLDPIVTNYRQIDPKLPAFTGDGEKFLVLQTPDYITNHLRRVKLAYRTGPNSTAIVDLRDYGSGTDEMIVFEGSTGVLGSTGAGAMSPMGYVLKRQSEIPGKFEVHIVFRGSRSGSAARALSQGMSGPIHGPTGNPDWVTDMASAFVKGADMDGVGGNVAAGMVHALAQCIPGILAAVREIAKQGDPVKVHVTGHSLGAALASTFCAALKMARAGAAGTLSKKVREGQTKDWPWDAVQGWFFALPPTADKTFCDAYARTVENTAPYCDGDPVVECSKSIGTMDTGASGKAGWLLGAGGYSAGNLEKLPKPASSASGENPHEIYLIRAALVTKLGKAGTPAQVRDAQPWGVYNTFRDVLDGRATNFKGTTIAIITRDNLRAILRSYSFAEHFELVLQVLEGVVANKASYRGKHWASTLIRIGENVQLARSLEIADDAATTDGIVDRVGTQVSIMCAFKAAKQQYLGLSNKAKAESDGSVDLEADDMLGQDFAVRIGLGMLLRGLAMHDQTSMADYEKLEVLRLCLATKLN